MLPPITVNCPGPEITPDNVGKLPSLSIVPPAGARTIERGVVNVAAVRSVPLSRVSAPDGAPRKLSCVTCKVELSAT